VTHRSQQLSQEKASLQAELTASEKRKDEMKSRATEAVKQ